MEERQRTAKGKGRHTWVAKGRRAAATKREEQPEYGRTAEGRPGSPLRKPSSPRSAPLPAPIPPHPDKAWGRGRERARALACCVNRHRSGRRPGPAAAGSSQRCPPASRRLTKRGGGSRSAYPCAGRVPSCGLAPLPQPLSPFWGRGPLGLRDELVPAVLPVAPTARGSWARSGAWLSGAGTDVPVHGPPRPLLLHAAAAAAWKPSAPLFPHPPASPRVTSPLHPRGTKEFCFVSARILAMRCLVSFPFSWGTPGGALKGKLNLPKGEALRLGEKCILGTSGLEKPEARAKLALIQTPKHSKTNP